MPCKTDLSALAAVAPTHIINPNKWKLGSPYKIEDEIVSTIVINSHPSLQTTRYCPLVKVTNFLTH